MPRNSRKSLKSYKSIPKSVAKIIQSKSKNRTRKTRLPPTATRPEFFAEPEPFQISVAPSKTKINTNVDMSAFIRIYRKTVSNLKIREEILHSIPSKYTIGPTLIWTEVPEDLSIFTTAESYTNYIGFEGAFSNPKSPKYLKKILSKMRMTKGTILIKEASDNKSNAMNIPVHFCGYRIDEEGVLSIFDPSWHSSDRGVYSTTAFYDSLDEFGIPYQHAEPNRKHHWQSLLSDDVFCQTWTLRWLYLDSSSRSFELPLNGEKAAEHIAKYMKLFSYIILKNIEKYMQLFPEYKLEGYDPTTVFRTIRSKRDKVLQQIIYDEFKGKAK